MVGNGKTDYVVRGKTSGLTSLSGRMNQATRLVGQTDCSTSLSGEANQTVNLNASTGETASVFGRTNPSSSMSWDMSKYRGYSAYEIAVMNGFKGTEQEWLASLVGRGVVSIEKVSSGDYEDTYLIKYTDGTTTTFKSTNSVGAVITHSSVTLYSWDWVGDDSPYSQVVTIDKATKYSKIDLQPSPEQLALFHDKDLAFVTENDDGVITVYAIGDKPTATHTIQVTITEVEA